MQYQSDPQSSKERRRDERVRLAQSLCEITPRHELRHHAIETVRYTRAHHLYKTMGFTSKLIPGKKRDEKEKKEVGERIGGGERGDTKARLLIGTPQSLLCFGRVA